MSLHFVLNIDPRRPPVGTVEGLRMRSHGGIEYGMVDVADLHYVEYRWEPETERSYVCVVYRMPELVR